MLAVALGTDRVPVLTGNIYCISSMNKVFDVGSCWMPFNRLKFYLTYSLKIILLCTMLKFRNIFFCFC